MQEDLAFGKIAASNFRSWSELLITDTNSTNIFELYDSAQRFIENPPGVQHSQFFELANFQ